MTNESHHEEHEGHEETAGWAEPTS